MYTNDLCIFAFESEALAECGKYPNAYSKMLYCGNDSIVWVVCKLSEYSNRVLFLRDDRMFS